MRRVLSFCLLTIAVFVSAQTRNPSAEGVIRPADNLVTENIPPIPMSVVEKADQYGEFRAAALSDWHPQRREMLITTRFADVPQVHMVKTPGGARSQLTFFHERVSGAQYPESGNFFIFSSDIGGGEWYQIYRYDVATGSVTMLTDGKSRNLGPVFEHHGSRFAYNSTRRTGQDTDIWVMDASNPSSDRMLIQLQGGGWSPLDWSHDGKQLLVHEGISANKSHLWLVDVATGQKKQITPTSNDEVAYGRAQFSADDKGIYVTTDRDNEFQRLAYFDLNGMQPHYLTSDIKWDVEEFDVSEDGKTIAFATNEDGIGKLYLLDTTSGKHRAVSGVPAGVVGGVRFHRNSHDVGFTVSSAKSPNDIYSVDTRTGKIDRWTFSETGGLNTAAFIEPQLIKWQTFDGKSISGFLYQPDAQKFPGKRPVIIDIHGGPEGQTRPGFRGRSNYFLNELGVALIYPNVRGSTGYGKTFLKLDNGFHREDTYKDIGALLDWIGQQPTLDASKIMVTGGSYGGHMTYAVATYYNDRIACSLPVVGITNLVSLLEHTEAYRRDLRRVEYGDERDPKMRAYLESIAPFNNWQKITKPLFAVVGKNDPRVPYSESRQLLDRLKNSGTATWFLMANDEGHGYAKKKNQDFQFYATVMFVKKFLLNDQSVSTAALH